MTRSQKASLFFCLFLFLALRPALAAAAQPSAKADWWRQARFGMFIHWGLYSQLAGEWQGKTDYGEWIRANAQIPRSEYAGLAAHFNPTHFVALDWVRQAKAAGMEYIVITTKHHDGFCLFDSGCGSFTIAATPWHKDIMAELAAACRSEGIRLGWYYSIMDWNHPDYLPRREWETNRPSTGAHFERYLAYVQCQLHELLTRYGDIAVMWFDGEWEPTWDKSFGSLLYKQAHEAQPGIWVNNRVANNGEASGDFDTPEQTIPREKIPARAWETCMTMNDHWGYNSHDGNWKSTTDLVRKLADIASKGGHFLLNVGPTAEGLFPEASTQRLTEIGRWMAVNGESIRATSASPLKPPAWGRITQGTDAGNARLYLHVFDWPADGTLRLALYPARVSSAYLLADAHHAVLAHTQTGADLVISLPTAAPDPHDSVVVLELKTGK
jgi:alpha-L-fucosidase